MACPTEYNHSFHLYTIQRNSAYLTYISSVLSILGCILIISAYILWKDVRQSTARVLLLFLAIADLGTGLGYLMAVVGFSVIKNDSNFTQLICSEKYINFGRVQSFITTFFPVSSFFWTSVMGLYFLSALVFRRHRWGLKVLVIVNVICWGLPFVFLIVMSSLHILGPGKCNHNGTSSAAATWSFVSDNTSYTNTTKGYLVFEALCGKMWEMLSYFIVLGCYLIIVINHRHKKSSISQSLGDSTVITRAIQNTDLKLMLIPAVFIFLRMWGSIRYLTTVCIECQMTPADPSNPVDFCVSKTCYYTLYNFTYYFQAFCDPAQGFGNAILFVVLSNPIRTRFIRLIYIKAYRMVSLCRRCLCRRDDSSPTGSLDNSTPLLSRKADSVTYSPSSTRRVPVDVQYSDCEIRYGSTDSKEKSCNL